MKLHAIIASTGIALAATLFSAQAEAQSVNAYATTNVNLRAGPSTSYPAITVVPAGASIANNGCLADYSWCDVSYANYRGWLAARYMKVVYQGQRQVLTPGIAFATGVAITAFSQSYWNNYYRGYPWYGTWNRYPPPPPPRPYLPPPGWRAPPGWGGPPPGWRAPPGYRPGWGAPPPRRPPPHAAPPPPHRPPPGVRPPYYGPGPGPVRPGPSMRPGERHFGERRFDRR